MKVANWKILQSERGVYVAEVPDTHATQRVDGVGSEGTEKAQRLVATSCWADKEEVVVHKFGSTA